MNVFFHINFFLKLYFAETFKANIRRSLMIASCSKTKTLQIGYRSCNCAICIKGELKNCSKNAKYVKEIPINDKNWIGKDNFLDFITQNTIFIFQND